MSQICADVRTVVDGVRQMTVSLTDPGRLRNLFDSVTPPLKLEALGAPATVKAPVGMLATAVGQLKAALDPVGYDIARLAPPLVMTLQSPDVAAALLQVDDFVRKAC